MCGHVVSSKCYIKGDDTALNISTQLIASCLWASGISPQASMAQKRYTWKEAFEDSLEAARAGNPRAQNFVGYCYDLGKGVSRDSSVAQRWYSKAAQQGNVDAMFNLALSTK